MKQDQRSDSEFIVVMLCMLCTELIASYLQKKLQAATFLHGRMDLFIYLLIIKGKSINVQKSINNLINNV